MRNNAGAPAAPARQAINWTSLRWHTFASEGGESAQCLEVLVSRDFRELEPARRVVANG